MLGSDEVNEGLGKHRAAGKECSVAIYYSMVTSTFSRTGQGWQIIDNCDATVPGSFLLGGTGHDIL